LSPEKVFTIAVTDVNEAPTVAAQPCGTMTLAENVATSLVKVADIVITDDALGVDDPKGLSGAMRPCSGC
jgi:hypothetical protein